MFSFTVDLCFLNPTQIDTDRWQEAKRRCGCQPARPRRKVGVERLWFLGRADCNWCWKTHVVGQNRGTTYHKIAQFLSFDAIVSTVRPLITMTSCTKENYSVSYSLS